MSMSRQIHVCDLNALVDGELAEEERAELESLLQAAPAEQGLVRDLRDLNQALAARYAHKLNEPVPARMLERLRRLPARRASAPGARGWALPAAAVVLAILAGAGGFLLRNPFVAGQAREPAFVANAIGAHSVYAPEVRHPVEVKAAEDHLVRWLTRRVGAPFLAPSLSAQGFSLMGGRLVPDRGLPAAQFMYEDATGRRLTIYIRKETGLNNTSFRFAEKEGFAAFYWIDAPLAYAVSGRLGREELLSLAHAVYAQLEAVAGKEEEKGQRSP